MNYYLAISSLFLTLFIFMLKELSGIFYFIKLVRHLEFLKQRI